MKTEDRSQKAEGRGQIRISMAATVFILASGFWLLASGL
jgi:hypothetical protein